MPFNFATARANSRRVVHSTFAVDAYFTDSSVDGFEPTEIKARWHNKLALYGDPEQEGYAQILQGIDRIVLIPSDYPHLEFAKGDIIEFGSPINKRFSLQSLEPSDGPLKGVWHAQEES